MFSKWLLLLQATIIKPVFLKTGQDVVTESKLEICTLLPQEIIENMSFHGTINCACGTYGNIHMQLYYTDFPEKDYYVIFRVVMDGKDVYNNPKSVRSFTGMIELTL